jgi:hypothetical protein
MGVEGAFVSRQQGQACNNSMLCLSRPAFCHLKGRNVERLFSRVGQYLANRRLAGPLAVVARVSW